MAWHFSMQKYESLIVVGLALLGLGLRLWGLDFSLPHANYADEPVLIKLALQDGARLVGLSPAPSSYPQALPYLLLGFYGVYYIIGLGAGWFESASDLLSLYVANPTPLFLIGRTVSAVVGASAVPFLYLAGTQLFDRVTGGLAAAMLAVNYFLVYFGHIAVTEAMLSATSSLALLLIAKAYVTGHRKIYVTAGCAIGLGVATKLTPAFLFASLTVAHLLRQPRPWRRTLFRPSSWWNLGLAVCGVFITVVVLSPDLLPSLVSKQEGEFGTYLSRYWSLDFSNLWRLILYRPSYWQQTAVEPVSIMVQSLRLMGDWVLFLSLVGVLYGLFFFPRRWLIVLAGPLALYLYLGLTSYPYLRQISLVIPFLVLVAAAFVVDFGRRLPFSRRHPQEILIVGLAAIVLAQPAYMVFRLDSLLARPGTQAVAADWIQSNIPSGSTIALDPMYTPFSQFTDEAIAAGDGSGTNLLRAAYADNVPDYDLVSTVETRLGESSADLFTYLVERDVQYVVVADYYYRRFYIDPLPTGTLEPEIWQQGQSLYNDLESQAVLVTTFEPKALQGVGPLIKVYALEGIVETKQR